MRARFGLASASARVKQFRNDVEATRDDAIVFDLRLIAGDLPYIFWGVPLTLGLALGSFALGAVLSVPFAYITLGRVPFLDRLVAAWIQFFTVTPSLVHITWIYYVLPIAFGLRLSAAQTVILALGAETSAYLAVILRGAIQAVPKGQWRAAVVLGLNGWQRAAYVVLPQTLRLVVPPSTNMFVLILKETSIASVLAVPEILNRGMSVSANTFRPIEVLTTVALTYFVVAYPFVQLASALERRSRAGFETA
jgi:polar amino acid transport system permease protein